MLQKKSTHSLSFTGKILAALSLIAVGIVFAIILQIAYAEEVDNSVFSVTTPTTLTLVTTEDMYTYAGAGEITNNSIFPMTIDDVSLELETVMTTMVINEISYEVESPIWDLVSAESTDFSELPIGSNDISFELCGRDFSSEEELVWDIEIGGEESYDISYELQMGPQSSTATQSIGTAVFIFSWDAPTLYNYTWSDYSEGYEVSLTDGLLAAINKDDPSVVNIFLDDDGGIIEWSAGEPLPSPLTEYNDQAVISMDSMFWKVEEVSLLDLSEWDVSNIVNFCGMFGSDFTADIETLNLSGWDTSSAVYMDAMFVQGNFDKIIGIESFDLSSAESISYMFCLSTLTSLDLSDWDVSNVTDMNSIFCLASAEYLNLSGWDVSNGPIMYCFFGSSGFITDNYFDEIDVSNWIIGEDTDFDELFHGVKTDELDLSTWDISEATNFENMFYDSEINILILRNWEFSEDADTSGLFENNGTTTVYLSYQNYLILSEYLYGNTQDDNIIYVYDMPFYEYTLNEWDNVDGYGVTLSAEFEAAINEDDYSVVYYFTDENDKSIAWSAGQALPSPATTYNGLIVESLYYTFTNIVDVDLLDLSEWDVSNIVDMGGAFADSRISFVNLIGWDTKNVAYMDGMFAGGIFETISGITNWETPNLYTTTYMFCLTSVPELNLSNWDVSNVIDMAAMFCIADMDRLYISGWDVSNGPRLSCFFMPSGDYSENYYEVLDMSNWILSEKVSFEESFVGLSAKELDLSSWDVSEVLSFRYMFSKIQIDKLNLENWKFSEDADILWIFEDGYATVYVSYNNYLILHEYLYGDTKDSGITYVYPEPCTEHSYDITVIYPSTCCNAGTALCSCSVCGYEEYISIELDPTAHECELVTVSQAPTESEDGYVISYYSCCQTLDNPESYTPIYLYTLTYNDNEPDELIFSNETQTETTSSNNYCSFIILEDDPVRTGYVFEGWGLDPEGTVIYQQGDSISTESRNITLYAIWSEATASPASNDVIEPYSINQDAVSSIETDGENTEMAEEDTKDTFSE